MVHDAVGVALDEGQLVLVVAGHCATKMFQPNLPTKIEDIVPIVIHLQIIKCSVVVVLQQKVGRIKPFRSNLSG